MATVGGGGGGGGGGGVGGGGVGGGGVRCVGVGWVAAALCQTPEPTQSGTAYY